MPFVDDLLPDLDDIRAIPGELGLYPLQIFVRVTTWNGTRVGEGTKTVVDTPLTVGSAQQPVKARQLTQRDVVASGGLYQAQDIRVGPLTPEYDVIYQGGGTTNRMIDPAVGGQPTEVQYIVNGTSRSPNGDLYERVGGGDEEASALHRYFVIRALGRPA